MVAAPVTRETSRYPCRQTSDQQFGQVVDERDVPRADGRHLDDLAPDELDAIGGLEDADFGHVVVFRTGEQLSRG